MAQEIEIEFLPTQKKELFEKGVRLFDAAHKAGLPVASSCDGDGVCGKCDFEVVAGAEGLSPQTELEKKLLLKEKKVLSRRISCQTFAFESCRVKTSYW